MTVANDSRITSVTVYSDRALVKRVARVMLSAADTSIRVGGLPAGLERQSLRAGGSGKAAVKIAGVSLQTEYIGVPVDEERKAVWDSLVAIRDRKRSLETGKEIIDERAAFMRGMAKSGKDDLSKTVVRKRISLDECKSIIDFYYDSIAELSARAEEHVVALRDVDNELARLEARWNQLQSPNYREALAATVSVAVDGEGDFDLELSYVIHGAGWNSLYDIRFGSSGGKVLLGYRAEIAQRTGEDWNDVDLYLSTARPSMSMDAPEPVPRYIDFYVPAPLPPPMPMVMPSGARAASVDALLAEEQAAYAGAVESEVVSAGGPSVTYSVPGQTSVAGDGAPRTVTVSERSLPADMERVIVPELDGASFMRAEILNDSPIVYLEGPASIFRDNDFIGYGNIPLVNPGAKFKCPLGMDERVRAEYLTARKDDDSAGLTGSVKRISMSVAMKISSNLPEEEPVRLFATRPVALNKDIKIKSFKFSEKPKSEGEDGIIEWSISVKPGEEKTVSFEYDVEFPKDRRVSGL